MASRTRRLVCSEIGRLPVRTYETVLWDTPATRATSLLVYAAIANPLLTCRYASSIRIVKHWRNCTAACRKSQDPLAQLEPPLGLVWLGRDCSCSSNAVFAAGRRYVRSAEGHADKEGRGRTNRGSIGRMEHALEKRVLGASGLEVSALGLGCMGLS